MPVELSPDLEVTRKAWETLVLKGTANTAALADSLGIKQGAAYQRLWKLRRLGVIGMPEGGRRGRGPAAGDGAPAVGAKKVRKMRGGGGDLAAPIDALPAEVRGPMEKAASTFVAEIQGIVKLGVLSELAKAKAEITTVMLAASHRAQEHVTRGLCAICGEEPLKVGQMVGDKCTARWRMSGDPTGVKGGKK